MNLKKLLLLVPVFLLMLGSCKNVPDHTKYIPEDAATVIGINTKQLTKDVAWNVLKDSELFKKMKGRSKDSTDGFQFDKSGIDITNTSYFYVRPDARYGSKYRAGTQVVALIPLKSKADWEAEMKRVNPNKEIKDVDGRRQMQLDGSATAIWKDDILVITSKSYKLSDDQFADVIKEIFDVKKSLSGNKKFKALMAENNDISVFVNYEIFGNQMMDNDVTGAGAVLKGLAMSDKLFKGAVATAGINFEDGEIVANALYYPSDEMKDISKDMYQKADPAFLNMLPKENTNAVTAMNFAPEAMLKMIDKLGVKGLLNLELGKQGLTVDDILNSFTGDVVASVNNFRSVEKPNPYAAYYTDEPAPPYYDYEMDFVFAMKLKDKTTLQKLIALGKGVIDSLDATTYMVKQGGDTVCIKLNDEYLVVSNKMSTVSAFINGDYKSGNKSDGFKFVESADAGIYIDIQSFLNQVKGREMKEMAMVQQLLKDFRVKSSVDGGDASKAEAKLTFQNQKENSLLQLINLLGQID